MKHPLRFGINRWLALVLLMCLPLLTQARNLDDIAVDENAVTLNLSDGVNVSLRFLPYNSVEVEYHEPGEGNLPGLALAPQLSPQRPAIEKNQSGYVLTAGKVSINVTASPFKLTFGYQGEVKTAEASGYFNTATLRGFRFQLKADEKLYGGGQRVLGMDRRGHKMPLYNQAHYGYTTESDQMYYSLPAVLSSSDYAILFDNTAKGSLDIGASEKDILQFSAVAGRRAYIVTLGNSTRDVATNVVSVTGRQPLPSRWTLGNFASRFGYHTEQETREVVQLFQKEDMPLDAVVLDLYWFGKDVKGHMGNLEWDSNAFPDPESMIADFKQQNIKTILITEPFILTSSAKYGEATSADALAKNIAGGPKTFDFFFGNTGLVDVFSDGGQAWFSAQYQRLLKQGVAGFWGDLGEPEVHPQDTLHQWNGQPVTADEIHNAYGHKWAQLVYNTLQQAQPEKRPFLLMRAGFLGSQRYAMVPWTGDVSRSWGGLKPQVELALQMSVFGLAYTHSDLGGFAGGEAFDAQLYLRWLQLGEFQPVFRPHAQEDIAPEPVFHSQRVKNVARKILHERYAMLPYNYSLMAENSLTGMPLMRPLSFYHDSPEWFDHVDSFYWGPSLLVAPITEPDVKQWQVSLPPGIWFERETNQRYEGNQQVSVATDITSIPVFIKNGAIIPKIEAVNNTAQADFSRLQVHVWAGQGFNQNTFTYFEDDGVSVIAAGEPPAYQIKFSVKPEDNQIALSAQAKGEYDSMPSSRRITWHIHGLTTKPAGVTQNGQPINNQAVSWSSNNQVLKIKQDFNATTAVIITP
ncbi:TIM-barrel domain-containing protein [Salinimonas chungwhensis]|uniref:TIM-barrel domain-containing protein n=1 Tax=Salinimonas chungwhensis TaxID=265425 RepID=UPI00036D85F1|nr:TIM-barrel domain-containing protein [Salinimonas chungwhensis]